MKKGGRKKHESSSSQLEQLLVNELYQVGLKINGEVVKELSEAINSALKVADNKLRETFGEAGKSFLNGAYMVASGRKDFKEYIAEMHQIYQTMITGISDALAEAYKVFGEKVDNIPRKIGKELGERVYDVGRQIITKMVLEMINKYLSHESYKETPKKYYRKRRQ